MRETGSLKMFVAAASFALACLAAPLPALADAIDGAWCSPDGKHLKIAGRKIHRANG